MPEVNTLSKKAVSTIDAFKFVFPESDPDAATAYGKMLATMFDFEVPEFASAVPFSGDVEVYCLPDVTVSKVRTAASRLTRDVRTIARSASDEIIVIYYPRGHFTCWMGDTERRVESGEIAFFDLSQELIIEAPYVENISFAISRRRLEALIPNLGAAHGLVTPPSPLTKVLIATAEQVVAAGAATQPAEAAPIAEAIITLVGACLETLIQAQPAASAAASPVSLASLKAAIEQQLTNADFGPQSLLTEFGVTRSTLYRAFEPLGGVATYINERRLRFAFRQLTDPAQKDLRLSQLAFDLGFAHASAFTRSFKAHFGLTPKDVRTLSTRPKGKDVPYTLSPAAVPYLQSDVPGTRDDGSQHPASAMTSAK